MGWEAKHVGAGAVGAGEVYSRGAGVLLQEVQGKEEGMGRAMGVKTLPCKRGGKGGRGAAQPALHVERGGGV